MPPFSFGSLARPVNIQSHRLKQTINVFRKWMHFPNDFEVVELLLGAFAAHQLPGGCTLWLMLVGPSGGGKTELINSFEKLPNTHYASHITEAGLLCGKVDDKTGIAELRGGLLHKVGAFGYIMIPEFSGILASNHKGQPQVLSLLRQVYDGHVYRDIGSDDGGKRLHWRGRCSLIAASAPGVDTQRSVIAEMGERFIYYRLEYSSADHDIVGRIVGRNHNRREQMREELKDAVAAVLTPVIGNPPEIDLAQEENDRLYLLAKFAAQCRSVVERNGSWQKDAEAVHLHETSSRLQLEMSSLFRGLLTVGVLYERAWEIVQRISWNSIPDMRAQVLHFLMDHTDPLDRGYFTDHRKIADALSAPQNVVYRALEDLALQRVVERFRPPLAKKERNEKHRWRLSEATWQRLALIYSNIPVDPRHGLLGAATVPPEGGSGGSAGSGSGSGEGGQGT